MGWPCCARSKISIHALREEGDPTSPCGTAPSSDFYPRPPRGGRRVDILLRRIHLQFLSTPSARRATKCGRTSLLYCNISIHALREEGDPPSVAGFRAMFLFLSTPSARRATTRVWAFGRLLLNFYPRPPRGGRPHTLSAPHPTERFLSTPSARRATFSPAKIGILQGYFYPRPPRGGRLSSAVYTLPR